MDGRVGGGRRIEWRQRAADDDDVDDGLSLPALYVERRRYVEAGNNNGGRRKHFLLPPLSKKSRDIKDEGACDRPRKREPRRGRERERRGDRGLFYIT